MNIILSVVAAGHRWRRPWVQVLPCASEWVRGQSTQSLWRIPCPPPEQKLSEFLLEKDPLGQKKRKYIKCCCSRATMSVGPWSGPGWALGWALIPIVTISIALRTTISITIIAIVV